MKVEWDVSDKDLFIEKQYIFLRVYIGGDFDFLLVQVIYFIIVNIVIWFGIENSFLKIYVFICVYVYLENRSFENDIILIFQVNGIVRDFVFSGFFLYDGVIYYIIVIFCNGVKICMLSLFFGILVDIIFLNRGKY